MFPDEIERVKAAGRKLGARTIVGPGAARFSTRPAQQQPALAARGQLPHGGLERCSLYALSVIYTDEGVFRSGVNLGTPGNPTWA